MSGCPFCGARLIEVTPREAPMTCPVCNKTLDQPMVVEQLHYVEYGGTMDPGVCVHHVPLDSVCADCERNSALDAIVQRLDALMRALAQPRTIVVQFTHAGSAGRIVVTIPGLQTELAESLSADQLLGVMGVEIEPVGVEG